MITIEMLLQFGIAGIALYMLYDMNKNHLKSIEKKLEEIKAILKERL